MKKFTYEDGKRKFEDTEAFGSAWIKAKKVAMELHLPIYRTVTESRCEVYLDCGCFVGIDDTDAQSIRIF